MISVGILDTKGYEVCRNFESFLPPKECARLEKIKNKKACAQSFFSRLLLSKMYEDKFQESLPEISYTNSGKPYFDKLSRYFSVSHDKDVVVVALSDEENLGIDVQSFDGSEYMMKRIEKRFLSKIPLECKEKNNREVEFLFFELSGKSERFEIKSSKCELFTKEKENVLNRQTKDFLLRWTCLEASLKLSGLGFKQFGNVNESLQKEEFKTCFFQHGGICFALSLAFSK